MAERVVEDPVLRQRFSFRRTTEEDGGEVLLRRDLGGPGRRGDTAHPSRHGRALRGQGRPPELPGRQEVADRLPRRGGRGPGRRPSRLPQHRRRGRPHRLRGPPALLAPGVSGGRGGARPGRQDHPPRGPEGARARCSWARSWRTTTATWPCCCSHPCPRPSCSGSSSRPSPASVSAAAIRRDASRRSSRRQGSKVMSVVERSRSELDANPRRVDPCHRSDSRLRPRRCHPFLFTAPDGRNHGCERDSSKPQ